MIQKRRSGSSGQRRSGGSCQRRRRVSRCQVVEETKIQKKKKSG